MSVCLSGHFPIKKGGGGVSFEMEEGRVGRFDPILDLWDSMSYIRE